MNYRLFYPSAAEAAAVLGSLGAQARQDKAKEARKAFHRQMRADLGLPPLEALR